MATQQLGTAASRPGDSPTKGYVDRDKVWRFLASDIMAVGMYDISNMPTVGMDGQPLTWVGSPSGAVGVFILNGQTYVYTPQNAAVYVSQTLPERVLWGRMAWQFIDIGSTQNHTACLAGTQSLMGAPGGDLANMKMAIHLIATKTGITMGLWDSANGGFQVLETTPMALAGSVTHEMGYEILSASKCMVRLPDGTVRIYTDPQARFLDFAGPYVFGESYSPALTDGTVLLKSVHAGCGRAPSDLFAAPELSISATAQQLKAYADSKLASSDGSVADIRKVTQAQYNALAGSRPATSFYIVSG